MNNPFLRSILLAFKVYHLVLMPLRRRGHMGRPDAPKMFTAGAKVPWWIFCRWPLRMKFLFGVACETYFEDGQQQLYPLKEFSEGSLILGTGNGGAVHITGAPTHINAKPRGPRFVFVNTGAPTVRTR